MFITAMCVLFLDKFSLEFWWFLGVADTNDVIQKIEKTLNNTHTTTQKLTNNSFRNTKKHPEFLIIISLPHLHGLFLFSAREEESFL